MKKPILITVLLSLVAASNVIAITYDHWKVAHFTTVEQGNSAISGEAADYDNDNILNLMEYAQGRDPKISDSPLIPLLAVSKALNGHLTVSYPKLKGIADVDYVIETSSDMRTWNGGFGNAWTTQIIDNTTSTEMVTSVSLLPSSSYQFMRLKVVRTPRSSILAGITTNNAATNNDPVHLLDLCTVKSGEYAGGIVRYPMRPGPYNGYEDPNYVLNWYFANIALSYFVETEQSRVLNYMDLYMRKVDEVESGQTVTKYRIRDVDLFSSDFSVWHKLHPDSDDAYAGTFLYLVGKYRRIYGETWFRANKAKLKSIAYFNILLQIKGNGLTQTFQGGVSSDSDVINTETNLYHAINNAGYLMDNVQVWAGLKELVAGLQADPSEPQSEINYYANFLGSLEASIHGQLWDNQNNCWKPADSPLAYECNRVAFAFPPFYPFLQCQYFPELYGLPYANNPIETQRRYNMSWAWLEANTRTDTGVLTSWHNSNAWWSCDTFSHVDIAVVAAKRGELVKVNSFLQMVTPRWLPSATNHTSTTCDQIGYWRGLTFH